MALVCFKNSFLFLNESKGNINGVSFSILEHSVGSVGHVIGSVIDIWCESLQRPKLFASNYLVLSPKLYFTSR